MMVEIKRKIDEHTTLTINDLAKDPEIMNEKIKGIIEKVDEITKSLRKE